jgi:hypothetical protein
MLHVFVLELIKLFLEIYSWIYYLLLFIYHILYKDNNQNISIMIIILKDNRNKKECGNNF